MYRYIFYTQDSIDGWRKIHAIKHCKRPRATKVYKHMEHLFHSGQVAVFGYSIESNIDYICGCCGDHTSNVTWNEDLERDECNHCLVDNLKGR